MPNPTQPVIVEEYDELHGCDIDGCKGYAIRVRWPDGTEALECSAWLSVEHPELFSEEDATDE